MLRNATAYGISPRQRFDLVVPNLAGHAHVNGEVRLTSDGTPWRPLVHIRDIAAAVLAVLAAPADVGRGQAYNIGRNADNYRIREIAEQVQEAYPEQPADFRAARARIIAATGSTSPRPRPPCPALPPSGTWPGAFASAAMPSATSAWTPHLRGSSLHPAQADPPPARPEAASMNVSGGGRAESMADAIANRCRLPVLRRGRR